MNCIYLIISLRRCQTGGPRLLSPICHFQSNKMHFCVLLCAVLSVKLYNSLLLLSIVTFAVLVSEFAVLLVESFVYFMQSWLLGASEVNASNQVLD